MYNLLNFWRSFIRSMWKIYYRTLREKVLADCKRNYLRQSRKPKNWYIKYKCIEYIVSCIGQGFSGSILSWAFWKYSEETREVLLGYIHEIILEEFDAVICSVLCGIDKNIFWKKKNMMDRWSLSYRILRNFIRYVQNFYAENLNNSKLLHRWNKMTPIAFNTIPGCLQYGACLKFACKGFFYVKSN